MSYSVKLLGQWHGAVLYVIYQPPGGSSNLELWRSTNGGVTWEFVNIVPCDSTKTYTPLMVEMVWLSPMTGLICVKHSGTYRTVDGGKTLTQVDTATGVGHLAMHDDSRGYLVGATGLLKKTTDGGQTWATVDVSALISTTGINHVHCVPGSSTVAYVACNSYSSNGRILKTSDGSSWASASVGANKNVYAVVARAENPNYAAAMGSGNYCWLTIDGSSWSSSSTSVTWNANTDQSPRWRGVNTVEAFTVDLGAASMRQSPDGGNNWTGRSPLSTSNSCWCAAWLDDQRGFAATELGLFVTQNGGSTWQLRSVPHTTACAIAVVSGLLQTASSLILPVRQ